MKMIALLFVLSMITSCQGSHTTHDNSTDSMQNKQTGSIEAFDPLLYDIIDSNATVEIIVDSLDWSEGPLWLEKEQKLIFSDVPQNMIYQWSPATGKSVYLQPSGFTGSDISPFREPGSNGLILDHDGRLVLCQHGDRRIARMDAPVSAPEPKFITLADQYQGKKFTSPNDCVISSSGEIYFTDPPYGLKKMDKDPLKETAWNGVYKIKTDGTVVLLTDSMTKPNGIALFPGEKRLLVANSDPAKPHWYVWDISGDQLSNGKIFANAADHDASWKGLPDGMKIDSRGNVIASGPGGVYFFNREGKKLGMIHLQNPASNIALTADNKTIFITNDMYVLRVQMKP